MMLIGKDEETMWIQFFCLRYNKNGTMLIRNKTRRRRHHHVRGHEEVRPDDEVWDMMSWTRGIDTQRSMRQLRIREWTVADGVRHVPYKQ